MKRLLDILFSNGCVCNSTPCRCYPRTLVERTVAWAITALSVTVFAGWALMLAALVMEAP